MYKYYLHFMVFLKVKWFIAGAVLPKGLYLFKEHIYFPPALYRSAIDYQSSL